LGRRIAAFDGDLAERHRDLGRGRGQRLQHRAGNVFQDQPAASGGGKFLQRSDALQFPLLQNRHAVAHRFHFG